MRAVDGVQQERGGRLAAEARLQAEAARVAALLAEGRHELGRERQSVEQMAAELRSAERRHRFRKTYARRPSRGRRPLRLRRPSRGSGRPDPPPGVPPEQPGGSPWRLELASSLAHSGARCRFAARRHATDVRMSYEAQQTAQQLVEHGACPA